MAAISKRIFWPVFGVLSTQTLVEIYNTSDTHCITHFSNFQTNVYSPHEVALWSNHRVMEWLRAADLSEYAPNLRGSGVHGALIVYEPRFTADLLAGLLSIPSSKTLLRRHLSLRFNDLVIFGF